MERLPQGLRDLLWEKHLAVEVSSTVWALQQMMTVLKRISNRPARAFPGLSFDTGERGYNLQHSEPRRPQSRWRLLPTLRIEHSSAHSPVSSSRGVDENPSSCFQPSQIHLIKC